MIIVLLQQWNAALSVNFTCWVFLRADATVSALLSTFIYLEPIIYISKGQKWSLAVSFPCHLETPASKYHFIETTRGLLWCFRFGSCWNVRIEVSYFVVWSVVFHRRLPMDCWYKPETLQAQVLCLNHSTNWIDVLNSTSWYWAYTIKSK